MGKWSKFKKKLDQLPVDSAYKALVDEAKKPFLKKSSNDLALALGRTKRNKAKLDERIKLMNIEIAALEELLVNYLEDREQTQFRTKSGILVSLRDDIYPQVIDQKAFFAWIKHNRYAYLLSVHHKRLEGLIKQRLEEGEKLPDGVKAFHKTTINYTGKK
jgi:hypothetical protein